VVVRVAAAGGAVWILVALARGEDYVKRGDDGAMAGEIGGDGCHGDGRRGEN